MSKEKKEVKVVSKKGDRNEAARQAQKAGEFQTRRRYLDLRLALKHDENIIIINKEKLKNLAAQYSSGTITEKKEDGSLESKDGLIKRVTSLGQAIEDQERTVLYTKEDLMNLMMTRNIKVFDEAAKKHFKEVEEYYNKNVVQLK